MFQVLAENTGRVLSRAELARRAGIADLSARRCDSLIVGIRRGIGHDRVRTVRRPHTLPRPLGRGSVASGRPQLGGPRFASARRRTTR